MKKYLLLLAVALPLLFLETGVEVMDNVQSQGDQTVGEIQGGRTLGQAFVPRSSGLSRIDVNVDHPQDVVASEVILRLQAGAGGREIAMARVDASSLPREHGYYSFRFPALPDSEGQSYYFRLEYRSAAPERKLAVWGSKQAIYGDGALYVDGQPAPGSVAFRTFYERRAADMLVSWAAGLAGPGARPAAGAAIALIAPGYLLIVLLLRGARLDLAERLALALGLSLAAVAIGLLFTSSLNIRMTERRVGLIVLALLAAIGLYEARRLGLLVARLRPSSSSRSSWLSFVRSIATRIASQSGTMTIVAISFVFLLGLYSRLMQMPWLSLPLWADSAHHSFIVKLMVERGVIPTSLEPWWPIVSLTYHTGYHSFVAFFHWVTGFDILQSVSVVGQLINAASIPCSYLLAKRLTGNRSAGVFAGVAVGFVSLVPAYYINWGRYSQLAAQLILPAAIVLTAEVLDAKRLQWGWAVAAAVAVGGVFLVHVRVLVFYALFVFLYACYRNWQERKQPEAIWQPWLRLSLVGTMAFLLVSPRLYYLAGNLVEALSSSPHVSPEERRKIMQSYNIWGNVPSLWGGWIVVALSVASILWAGVRRHYVPILLVLWTLGLFALSFLTVNVLGIPALTNFSILTALYLPSSVAIGYLLADIYGLLRGRSRWAPLLSALAISVAVVWGVRSQAAMIDPFSMIVTKNDERAMSWIAENVPEQSVFLINASPSQMFFVLLNLDAGTWLPFLTGRRAVLPPMLYGTERGKDGGYSSELNRWYTDLLPLLGTGRELEPLKQRGVTHVFVGEKGGFIDVWKLGASRNYALVYSSGNARVFRVAYD